MCASPGITGFEIVGGQLHYLQRMPLLLSSSMARSRLYVALHMPILAPRVRASRLVPVDSLPTV